MKGLTLCKQWQSTPISKSDAIENKKEIITDRKFKKIKIKMLALDPS